MSVLWYIGWIFSVGYFWKKDEGQDWGYVLFAFVMNFFLWPLYMGGELASKLKNEPAKKE